MIVLKVTFCDLFIFGGDHSSTTTPFDTSPIVGKPLKPVQIKPKTVDNQSISSTLV